MAQLGMYALGMYALGMDIRRVRVEGEASPTDELKSRRRRQVAWLGLG